MADLGLIPVENRVVEHPNRYKLELVNAEENIYDLVAMPGAVAAEGTVVDKALLEAMQRAYMIFLKDYYSYDSPGQLVPTGIDFSDIYHSSAAVSIGDYALIGGGNASLSTATSRVSAFNTRLVKTTPAPLNSTAMNLAAAANETYGIFGGGNSDGTVTAYNKNLVSFKPANLAQSRMWPAATSVDKFVLFGGGTRNMVDAYSDNLVHTTPATLTEAAANLAAAHVGDYALFGGGDIYSYSPTTFLARVTAYNKSLVKTTAPNLSVARTELEATTIGEYALFGGGLVLQNSSRVSSRVIDAYNTNLVRTTAATLAKSSSLTYCAASTDKHAFFLGGGKATVYDENLVGTFASDPQKACSKTSPATSIGDYVISASGVVYHESETSTITIPRLSTYKFENFHETEQVALIDTEWSGVGKINGYIRRGGFTLTGKH